MGIYQFLSENGQLALEAGAYYGGYKIIRVAFKMIQLEGIKLDLRLPGKLKLSKLEINLSAEKIKLSASNFNF